MASVKTGSGGPNAAALASGQTGNGVSTNVIDRGSSLGPALIKITTVVGATPTCTYTIEGSADGTDWFPVAYCDQATPETVSVAPFTITTAGIARKILRPNQPWRFLRVTTSANTNVTNTIDVWTF